MSNYPHIAILDFGSQYTHLIARRVRELGVVSHIYPPDTLASELTHPTGVIISGGPKSVLGDESIPYDSAIFELGVPILGLCYGHQLMGQYFGGTVSKGTAREYGLAQLTINNEQLADIFTDVAKQTTVWMSHGDYVSRLPPGFVQLATTGNDSIAAMADLNRKLFGFQFHPEVFHSTHGRIMLKNFLFNICQAKKNWSTTDMLAQIEENIRREATDKKVFLLMSGGVDSTVCFALLEKTLGKERVYGLHIDHGLMRQNESTEVRSALATIGLDTLHVYNASAEFLEALNEVIEPEQKRKIIGNLFLDITDRLMKKLGFNERDWLLGQGTIYPDTIESGGTKHADKIKTHHNRVDRVHDMIEKGLIIEPIKELYKDEVRATGEQLGLPRELLYRHPFPGPGLAIRCLCSRGSEDRPTQKQYDNRTIYQLPIKSVGVQGDERTYAHPVVVPINVIPDGHRESTIKRPGSPGLFASADRPRMTHVDWEQLRTLSPRITNTYRDINRVLITVAGDETKLTKSKTYRATLTKQRLDLLREIDTMVNTFIMHRPDCQHIWQMPVVLVPFGYHHGESIVLRPIESEEVMTASFAELPENFFTIVVSRMLKEFPIDFIFYDVTNKPPGTVEWE